MKKVDTDVRSSLYDAYRLWPWKNGLHIRELSMVSLTTTELSTDVLQCEERLMNRKGVDAGSRFENLWSSFKLINRADRSCSFSR